MADDREPSILGAKASSTETEVEVEAAREAKAVGEAGTSATAVATPKRKAPLGRPRAAKGGARTFYVAGYWRRFAAAMVDLAIIVPVSLLLSWIGGAIAGIHFPPSRHRGPEFWLDLLLASDPALIGTIGLTLAIATIYVLVFQVTTAATPGMKLTKTRIIDVYGDAPSTARALARTAGYLGCAATLLLGFLWVGFDSEKRGLHDWISGTYVVKV